MSSFIYEDRLLTLRIQHAPWAFFFFLKNSRRILLIHLYSERVLLVLCPTAYTLQHLAFKEELPELKNEVGGLRGECGKTRKGLFSSHPVNVILSIPNSKSSSLIDRSGNDWIKMNRENHWVARNRAVCVCYVVFTKVKSSQPVPVGVGVQETCVRIGGGGHRTEMHVILMEEWSVNGDGNLLLIRHFSFLLYTKNLTL